LHIDGPVGSGKSSTASLLARIFGDESLYSAKQINYGLLKILSETLRPIVFDDLGGNPPPNLTRALRRAYESETEHRGNRDQTLTEYALTAPIVAIGEMGRSDMALMERCTTVHFDSAFTDENRRAFETLMELDLQGFATEYRLSVNVEKILESELPQISGWIPNSTSPRIADNIKAIAFGLKAFYEFGIIQGIYHFADRGRFRIYNAVQSLLSTA
jgi:hypothetical protein